MARFSVKLPPITEPIPVGDATELDDKTAQAVLLSEFGTLEAQDTMPMPFDPLGPPC